MAMGLWRRLLNTRPGHEFSGLWTWMFRSRPAPAAGQEWVAVHFKLSDAQFGTANERDAAHRFSDELSSVIEKQGVGVFDGDEFGNGEGVLFMYGPNADKLFDAVHSTLVTWEPLKGGHVIKRYGKKVDSERVDF